METKYAAVLAAVLGLVIGGVGTFTATDQSDALQSQGETIEQLNTSLTETSNALEETKTALEETETAFNEYRDKANSRIFELHNEKKALEAENTQLSNQLESFKPAVDVKYNTSYEVNRTESDQTFEDTFTMNVNEPRKQVNITLDYGLESYDLIDGSSTFDSLKVYDGRDEVGSYKANSWSKLEDSTGYEVTLVADQSERTFKGEYVVEITQDFDVPNSKETDDVVSVDFTTVDSDRYYIRER